MERGSKEGDEREKANHREHGGTERTQRLAEEADARAVEAHGSTVSVVVRRCTPTPRT